ncbi:MAG: aminotransferase class I/II-fold pyridoxal phosphate-dependent enzyme [Candidatus Caldarchaeum sp.]
MHAAELERLRSEARQLAVEIVRMLAARRDVVSRIAEIKRSAKLDTEQPDVEAAVRQAMLDEAVKHGIPAETVNRLATVILSDSVEMQSKPSRQLTHMDILRKAVEMQRNGREVLRLEVGEPDFGAPQQVREAVAKAVADGFARYVDSRGIPELRAALAKHIRERYGYEAKPDNLLVTPGGRFAIYLTMKTLLSEGDEIIIIDPSWPMYRQCASFVGARAVAVRTWLEDGWTPAPDMVEERISKSTKAILLNYPNNPTGKMLDRKTFSKIVDVAGDNNLTVVSDEVYADYTRGNHVSVLEEEAEKFVLIQSFSKSFGMTGYRVGYIVADENIISKMASVLGLVITCVPEFVQHGALKALSLKDAPRLYADIMMRRMDAAVRELEKIGASFYRPDGGMYVFPRVNTGGADGMKLAFDLLESKGVAVAPGSIFGGYDEFIRISLGASEESIIKGIRLLGEFLAEKGPA